MTEEEEVPILVEPIPMIAPSPTLMTVPSAIPVAAPKVGTGGQE